MLEHVPFPAEVSPSGRRFPASSQATHLVPVFALLSFVLLSACGSSSRLAVEPSFPEEASRPQTADDLPFPNVEERLRSEVSKWEGTPHLYGGESPAGIDCSAFVQLVYAAALEVQLPRTTREQVQTGRPVPRRDLRAGDLVFFRPAGKSRHVGIYLSNGEFAHASTSQGVTHSGIDERYWQESFWTSRRVLTESTRPVIANTALDIGPDDHEVSPYSEQEPHPPRRDRIGW
jgi:cell wall-associated NlpC family hydrolase